MKEVNPKKAMPLEQLLKDAYHKGFMKEEICCLNCGKEYGIDSEDFLTFYGNVTVGLNGGIIGNNFDEDGRLFRVHFFCRSVDCLPKSFFKKG